MDNLEDVLAGGRVTRSLRKRLASIDSDASSRPESPITSKLTPINELNSPSRQLRTRRKSVTPTFSKTPSKARVTRATSNLQLDIFPEESTPLRRSTRLYSDSIEDVTEQQQSSTSGLSASKLDVLPEENSGKKPIRKLRAHSSSKSPQVPLDETDEKLSKSSKTTSKAKASTKPGPKSKTKQWYGEDSSDISDVEIVNLEKGEKSKLFKKRETQPKREDDNICDSSVIVLDETVIEEKSETIVKETNKKNNRDSIHGQRGLIPRTIEAANSKTQTPNESISFKENIEPVTKASPISENMEAAVVNKNITSKSGESEIYIKKEITEEKHNSIMMMMNSTPPLPSPMPEANNTEAITNNPVSDQSIGDVSDRSIDDENICKPSEENRLSTAVVIDIVKLQPITPATINRIIKPPQADDLSSSSINDNINVNDNNTSKTVTFDKATAEYSAKCIYPKTPFFNKSRSYIAKEILDGAYKAALHKGLITENEYITNTENSTKERGESPVIELVTVESKTSVATTDEIISSKAITPPPPVITVGSVKELSSTVIASDDYKPKEINNNNNNIQMEKVNKSEKPSSNQINNVDNTTKLVSTPKATTPKATTTLMLSSEKPSLNQTNNFVDTKATMVTTPQATTTTTTTTSTAASEMEENIIVNDAIKESISTLNPTSQNMVDLEIPQQCQKVSESEPSMEEKTIAIKDESLMCIKRCLNFASSWTQGVSASANDEGKIDAINSKHETNAHTDTNTIIVPNSCEANSEKNDELLKRQSCIESNDNNGGVVDVSQEEKEEIGEHEEDEESNKNYDDELILDEAMDVGYDYKSGDSMDSEERCELEENEIIDNGESIGSSSVYEDGETNNDEGEDVEEYNSFIVNDSSDIEYYSDQNNELKQTENVKNYKRILTIESSDSEIEEIKQEHSALTNNQSEQREAQKLKTYKKERNSIIDEETRNDDKNNNNDVTDIATSKDKERRSSLKKSQTVNVTALEREKTVKNICLESTDEEATDKDDSSNHGIKPNDTIMELQTDSSDSTNMDDDNDDDDGDTSDKANENYIAQLRALTKTREGIHKKLSSSERLHRSIHEFRGDNNKSDDSTSPEDDFEKLKTKQRRATLGGVGVSILRKSLCYQNQNEQQQEQQEESNKISTKSPKLNSSKRKSFDKFKKTFQESNENTTATTHNKKEKIMENDEEIVKETDSNNTNNEAVQQILNTNLNNSKHRKRNSLKISQVENMLEDSAIEDEDSDSGSTDDQDNDNIHIQLEEKEQQDEDDGDDGKEEDQEDAEGENGYEEKDEEIEKEDENDDEEEVEDEKENDEEGEETEESAQIHVKSGSGLSLSFGHIRDPKKSGAAAIQAKIAHNSFTFGVSVERKITHDGTPEPYVSSELECSDDENTRNASANAESFSGNGDDVPVFSDDEPEENARYEKEEEKEEEEEVKEEEDRFEKWQSLQSHQTQRRSSLASAQLTVNPGTSKAKAKKSKTPQTSFVENIEECNRNDNNGGDSNEDGDANDNLVVATANHAKKRKRHSKSFSTTTGASLDTTQHDDEVRHQHKKLKETTISLHSDDEIMKSTATTTTVAKEPKEKPTFAATSTKKLDANKPTDVQRILGRCSEILEAANRAKLEAKINFNKNKLNLLQKKKKLRKNEDKMSKIAEMSSSPPVHDADDDVILQRKQFKRKEEAKVELEKALKASANIILNQNAKKPKLTTMQLTPVEKTDETMKLKATTMPPKQKKTKNTTNISKHSAHVLNKPPQIHTLKSAAGKVIEMPLTKADTKRSKPKEIQLSTGIWRVEPVTPKKERNTSGFRESPITPRRSLGFKVSHILTAGQDTPPAIAPHSKKRKRKLNVEEPIYTLPKPQWSRSGVFMEESLPSAAMPFTDAFNGESGRSSHILVKTLRSNNDKRKRKKSYSDDTVVVATSREASSASSSAANRALQFKNSALYRNNIARESARELLNRKQRERIRKHF